MTDTGGMEGVIERAAGGDKNAMAELWRANQHLLLRYFRGKGMAEPEDLASVVWVDVANGLQSFAGDEDDFRRWLFTIAARRRIDAIRSSKRRIERDRTVVAETESTESASAGEEYERSAALDRAIALVRRLPPDMAEAVLLRVVADLPVSDVAGIMDRSDGNVRVLVHRGLKRLAELALSEPGDADADNDDGNGAADPSSRSRVTNRRVRSMYAS